jgi:flagellar motor switch protein FliG
MTPSTSQRMTGLRKAAILMVLLGDKLAVDVFRLLPPKEVQRLTREITSLGPIPADLANRTVQEYKKAVANRHSGGKGDSDFAQKTVVQASGDTAGESLLKHAMKSPDPGFGPEISLQQADPQQLASLLEGESPQTIALVAAHLGTKATSSLLACLPEKLRPAVVERMAQMRNFSPEVVHRIAGVLERKIAALRKQSRLAFGGISAVANLMKTLDAASSRAILDRIEATDENLAASIRTLMFTFEDLLDVPATELREVLTRCDRRTLTLALKGASPELAAHVFHAFSSRATQMLREDMEVLGQVRARDVRRAQQEIADLARNLEAAGRLTRRSEDENAYVA